MSSRNAWLLSSSCITFAAMLVSAAIEFDSSGVERDTFQPSRKHRAVAGYDEHDAIILAPLAPGQAHLTRSPSSNREVIPGHEGHPDVDQVRKAMRTITNEPLEISQFVSPVTYQPKGELLEMPLSSDGQWNPWQGSLLDVTSTAENGLTIGSQTITGEASFESPLSMEWQNIMQHIVELPVNMTKVLHPSITAQRICIEGKLVPSLYLIGTQKAATTNFADKIFGNASFVGKPHVHGDEPVIHYKELAVFNDEARMQKLGKQGWLDYWPDCEDPVEFALDASPSYLASPKAPDHLVSWYGRLADQITIVVLLREPLARMHSAFYHMMEKLNGANQETFTMYVHRAILNAESGCLSGKFYEDDATRAACGNPENIPLGDPLRLSLYAPELTNWLRYFPAKNFVISPWKLYIHPVPGQESLVPYVVSTRMNCTFLGDGLPMLNMYHNKVKDQRPDLAEALTLLIPEEKDKLEKLVANLAGGHTLAKTLSPYMKEGLVLFGYKGHADDIPAIAKHIEDNW